MKKLLSILVNPFLLPLFPAVMVMALLPMDYARYRLEVEEQPMLPAGDRIWYGDLNGNGYSEQVTIMERENRVSVLINDHRGQIFDQWNFRGSTPNITFRDDLPVVGDHDGDGRKELYFFTLVGDSLFLHMLEDLTDRSPAIRDRFIAQVGPGIEQPDVYIVGGEMEDLLGDGYKELVFAVYGGFSLYPRSVFAYSVARDSLMQSPSSAYPIDRLKLFDLSGDGRREILLGGRAVSNVDPEAHRYHDHSNWLMVLDQDLRFLFEPVEYPGRAERLISVGMTRGGERVVAVNVSNRHTGQASRVDYYDAGGRLLERKPLDFPVFTPGVIGTDRERYFAFYEQHKGVHVMREDLTPIAFLPGILIDGPEIYHDLSGNGEKELIVTDINWSNGLYVFRRDSKRPASIGISPLSDLNYLMLSIRETAGQAPQVSVQVDRTHYLIQYVPNTGHYLAALYFVGIYSGILGFSLLTRRIQRAQIRNRLQSERKITELQLSLVKNQLNPHFSLNAINAAMQAVRSSDPDKAVEYLNRFSRLHRALLISAESLHRSLEEELAFCRDYVELERMRCEEAFGFKLQTQEGLDMSLPLPKMILQTHAENAIKHGLAHKDSKGLLTIKVSYNENRLQLEITDNGIGRSEARDRNTGGTGRGNQIMEEYFELYNKYYPNTVHQHIEDLADANGKASGTRVLLTITYNERSEANQAMNSSKSE